MDRERLVIFLPLTTVFPIIRSDKDLGAFLWDRLVAAKTKKNCHFEPRPVGGARNDK